MVPTTAGKKMIFWKEEDISLTNMKTQEWGYFLLKVIVNVTQTTSETFLAQTLSSVVTNTTEKELI